ncbi:hypothetical protein CASFOL_000907 [Castilleja foliolosa]|uniref:Transcriptional coactivator Hfi1/Transcriptional adapter 1 n=1 Tax=Castilleja foliolosa TaxID=1961234 RepID=A0ABD3EPA8_9LAMI
MQPPHQHSRINLAELKAQIVKKLGPEGSKQYFCYLNRFLSLKLNKVEFNKLCLRIVGRDNIPLHNQLIRSILKNACDAKSPPTKHTKDISSNSNNNNNYQPNGSHATMAQPSFYPPGLPNGGDMLLPPSPKKARTGLRDRRGGDRRSTLGLVNGKTGLTPQPSDNGELKPENENSLVLRSCSDFSAPSCSVEQTNDSSLPRSPIRAPLGVTFCPASSARSAPSFIGSVFNDGFLSDSVSLKERMEHIALTQGIEGVSLDSANLLNHGLDSYMKRLIRSCVELVGSRHSNNNSNNNNSNNNMNKHHVKLVNGVKPGYQNLGGQERSNNLSISLEDFRVAMVMNPRKLGEDWPLLLEKICTNAFEE